MTTLTIVIPAYNEENGIAEIINRVLAVKEDLKKVGVDDLELLVVNDGSRDRTREIAEGISAERSLRACHQSPQEQGLWSGLEDRVCPGAGGIGGFP